MLLQFAVAQVFMGVGGARAHNRFYGILGYDYWHWWLGPTE